MRKIQAICAGSFSELNLDNGQLTKNFSGFLSGYTFREEGLVKFRDYQFNYGFHRFLFKKDFLLKNHLFFPDLSRYQDAVFLAKTLHVAGSFYAIPEVVYQYSFQPSKWKEIFLNSQKFKDSLDGLCFLLEFSLKNNYLELAKLVLEQLRFHSKYYASAFEELSASNAKLLNSRSWRYTSPLRELKKIITINE